MNIEVTEQEREFMLELIDSAEQEMIQGVDHADSRAFKELLRNRLDLLGSVRDKMKTATH
jgi:hypothetical protein